MTPRHRITTSRHVVRRAAVGAARTVALAGAAHVATYGSWRSWCITWGATEDEATCQLPGDELLDETALTATRAIGIAAPPEAVWPWLAQMGSGRGGVYTYDWIENLFGLKMHSVDVVLPQFQDVEVGDAQTLGKNGPTMRVAVCERDSTLVLRSDNGDWVWAFVLVPVAGGTRLLSRNRIATPGASWLRRAFNRYVMEPGSLVMERKMLLGIKERAERLDRGGPTTARAAGAGAGADRLSRMAS